MRKITEFMTAYYPGYTCLANATLIFICPSGPRGKVMNFSVQ